MRFLHMGYGSGSLMRFLRRAIPKSQHTAIDLDPTVASAAIELGLLDPSSPCETLVIGDALEFPSKKDVRRFRGICIDVFDGANLMPAGFYAVPFLETLRDNLLLLDNEANGDSCALLSSFVIHNFHVGTERLGAQLENAMESYRTVFGRTNAERSKENTTNKKQPQRVLHHSLYRVDSLNTNNHGGNTILIAILNSCGDAATDTSTSSTSTSSCTTRNSWLELAALATERWEENRFDLVSRIEHAQPF